MVIEFKHKDKILLSMSMDSKDVFVPQVCSYVSLTINGSLKFYLVRQVLYEYESDSRDNKLMQRANITVYLHDSNDTNLQEE